MWHENRIADNAKIITNVKQIFYFFSQKSKELDNKIKFNNALKPWPNLSIFLNEIFIFI